MIFFVGLQNNKLQKNKKNKTKIEGNLSSKHASSEK